MHSPDVGRRSHAKIKPRWVPTAKLARLSAIGILLLTAGAVLGQAAPYYGWTAPPEFQGLQNPIAANAESVGRGKGIFEQRCVQCHGMKGEGEGESAESLRVPPGDLTDKKRMNSYSDGTLFWKIQVGRGEMPPWQLTLKEEEIWHVINYIHGLASQSK